MKRISTTLLAALASCSLCISAAQVTPAHAAAFPAPHAAPAQSYVVKAGDTLLAIAMKFGVSMAAIQIENDLDDPAMIRAGQTLKIPAEKVNPGENAFWTVYVVKAGDTLGAISKSLDIDMNDLLKANKMSDASMLQIGQKLVVPVNGVAAQPEQAAAPAAAEPQTIAPKQAPAQQTQPTVELIPLDQPVQQPATQPQPAPQAQPTPIPVAPQVAASGDVETIRQSIFAYYNQARVANGLPPLTYSTVLQAAAQAHADDCAARNQGSHFGSDGSRSSQRIARAGYTGRITGENWAWARSAENAFDMWYTQEIPNGPHLINILSPRYTEVGFGITANRGGYYLIANFGGQ
jgi:uncharacterized protein YkwD